MYFLFYRVFHILLKNHCACTLNIEFVKSQNGKNKHTGNRKVKTTEPWKGRFFSNIFQKRSWNKKEIGKEIKTIIYCLNDLLSFLSNIEQNRN